MVTAYRSVCMAVLPNTESMLHPRNGQIYSFAASLDTTPVARKVSSSSVN
jgi:hypothetical protein